MMIRAEQEVVQKTQVGSWNLKSGTGQEQDFLYEGEP